MGEKILAQLERLVYWLQRRLVKTEASNKFITSHFAFLHLKDRSQKVLILYQIRLARALGKKIVLVTGCFDILHQEHLKFLKKAKKEGSVLVVGLESDKRIKKIKGKERPVNFFKIRAENLIRLNVPTQSVEDSSDFVESPRCNRDRLSVGKVDFILELPCNFDKKAVRLETLRLIKPHILAISSNDPLEKRKRKECQKIDCHLKVVHQYNHKISTTKILDLDKKEKVF